jgi:hypothetical protein
VNNTDSYYAREADRLARGPQIYGGDARIAALRAFRRYDRNARVDMVGHDGHNRWMAPKMLRVHAIVHRQAMKPEGGLITMGAIAAEAGCSVGYVSKVVVKLQAWSFFWFVSLRGRNGGLWVFARTLRDGLDHWAQAARQKLAAIRDKVLARLALNLSSTHMRREEGVETGYLLIT